MKQIIKYISVLMLLLCSTEAFALRGGCGVDKGTVTGGDIAFYSDENCKNAISERPKANAAVYIKATANYSKRLGTADAQGKVSFIKAEQTVSSGVAMTRGDVLGLGEYVDVYQVSKTLDEGIYKFTMPADENINVLVSVEFADPAPNQHAQITSVAAKYAIDENADKGTVLAQITVVDKAKVDGNYEKLSYILKSNNDTQKFNETFEVNEVNNFAGVRTVEISVKNQELLDYESVKFGGATLYVVNESGDYACAHFDIFVNDLSEDFTISNQAFTLPEKQDNGSNWQVGKEVGNVIINDPDNGAVHTYKVITTGVPFNFAPGTNKLVVADGSVLDYDTKPTWTFNIKVSDGEYTHNAAITVKLTDVNEAPMISDCKNNYTVKENSANGTELGVFKVFDCDKDDKLNYSLESTDLNNIFELKEKSEANGTRTVSIVVKNASMLDYENLYKTSEENATYPITITATDTGRNSASVNTYITIEDENEGLTAFGGTFYLNEHSPIGSCVSKNTYTDDNEKTVGKVESKDEDSYNADFRKISYQMSNNYTSEDAKKFNIDPRSGLITSAAVFDYEKDSKQSYTFLVTASDGKFSTDVEVNVNITNIDEITAAEAVNHAPTITNNSSIEVAENKTGVIGSITATDPDTNADPSWGFAKLHYMLEDVIEVGGSTDFPFEIDENTGEISVREGETLNYAKQKKYQFIVRVADCPVVEGIPSLSTIANVTINITDVNRPSKFISLSNVYEVEENVDPDTEVNGDKILVYDDDQEDVNQLTITIRDNNATAALDAAKLFEVVQVGKTNSQTHESTFVIKAKSGLDYEAIYNKTNKDTIFDVTLTIKDSEERTKYPQKNCKIRVIDVNEEPFENKKSFSFSVDENTTASTKLGKVEVRDPDMYKAEYGTLYYSLIDKDAAQFAIDAEGNLSTIYGAKYDYETKNKYEFRVEVTDKNYRITVPVTVTINNMCETPAFAEVTQVLLVDESAEKGTEVGTITAKSDAAPKYSFVTDLDFDDYKYFDIDGSTGVITVKDESLADFNTKHEYHVMVKATDGENTDYYNRKEFAIKVRLKMENLFSSDNAFTSYVAPDNMAVPEGLSAYVITDIDGSSATISQIDYLPQSMPVLLKRADKEEKLFKTVTGNGTAFFVNKLMINETDREVSAGELYLLYRDEFVLCSSGTLPAGSVYLPITDVTAKTRSLTIGDGENTTSIDNVKCQITDDEWYDLQGRRLGSKPTKKGIYISNGSKVVIK